LVETVWGEDGEETLLVSCGEGAICCDGEEEVSEEENPGTFVSVGGTSFCEQGETFSWAEIFSLVGETFFS